MGQTKIEWTATYDPDGTVTPGYTWNPWRGCFKVSQGCKHCYMYREQERYGKNPAEVVRAAPATFNGPLKWKEQARVFTCSWSDFFISDADSWRAEAWEIIEKTPHLTYQILTKRPENMWGAVPERWLVSGAPKNIWFGVSAEDQDSFDTRWPVLESFAHAFNPAVVFLSLEPLLGPIDLSWSFLDIDVGDEEHTRWTHPVDWIIVGGESGPHARKMELDWVRSIVHQCQGANVPVFVKQLGTVWARSQGLHDKGGDPETWPDDLRVREFPVLDSLNQIRSDFERDAENAQRTGDAVAYQEALRRRNLKIKTLHE